MIYKFTEQQRDEAEAKLLSLISEEKDNDKIESLQEVLDLLSGIPDNKTLAQVIAAAIEDALDTDGAIATAISGAFATALGEGGDITTAISGAITTAIDTGGTIKVWADENYAPKVTSEI